MSDTNNNVDLQNITLTLENIPHYIELLNQKKQGILVIPKLSEQHFQVIAQIDEMIERLNDLFKKLKTEQANK